MSSTPHTYDNKDSNMISYKQTLASCDENMHEVEVSTCTCSKDGEMPFDIVSTAADYWRAKGYTVIETGITTVLA